MDKLKFVFPIVALIFSISVVSAFAQDGDNTAASTTPEELARQAAEEAERQRIEEAARQLQDKISSTNSEIEALEKEIAKFQEDLTAIGSEKDTLSRKIRTLDITRKKLETDVKVTERKIGLKSDHITQLSRSIKDKDSTILIATSSLAKSIRIVAANDNQALAEMVLAQTTIGEVWDVVSQLTIFQQELAHQVRLLKELRKNLSDNKTTVEKERKELERLRATLGDQKRVADNTRKRTDQVLKETKNKESEYQKTLAEKARQKEELERAIADYEAKLEYLFDPSKVPPAGKGVLSWPLDKVRITQLFGKTVSAKRLYVSGTHNGVDFGIPIGTPVRATASGTVIGTGNTDIYPGCYSYGKWVMVKHDTGISTIYGHLDHVRVAKGQEVARGETIAYSGDTGYSTGPHLHLGVLVSEAVRIVRLGDVVSRATKCANSVIPVAPQNAYLDPMVYL